MLPKMRPITNELFLHQEATRPLLLADPDNLKNYDGLPRHRPMKLDWLAPEQKFIDFTGLARVAPRFVKAIVCLVVVPLVFGWPLTLLTFSTHWHFPVVTWILVWCGVLPVIVAFLFASKDRYASRVKNVSDVRWGWISFVLILLAWMLGTVIGDINYTLYMQKYYFIHSLKTYTDIDPAEVSGKQMMDAGVVRFKEGVRVLQDYGMSFTFWDTFCVAPIAKSADGIMSALQQNQGSHISAQTDPSEAQGTYDMWAVGKNCCTPDDPTFRCIIQDEEAHSGLRQMNVDERQYFALAVQQAQAAYDFNVKHPLFFYWVKDGSGQADLFFEAGFKTWILAMFMVMGGNVIMVAALIWCLLPRPVPNQYLQDITRRKESSVIEPPDA